METIAAELAPMVKIIPARIENGQVIPDEPIPDSRSVRGVSIVIDLGDSGTESTESKRAAFSRLSGLLKTVGTQSPTVRELKDDYAEYLDRKYR